MNGRGRNRGHSSKKTSRQVSNYKSFLSDPYNQPDDTVDVCNDSLTGTDILQYQQTADTQKDDYIPMPWKKKAKKWIADNSIISVFIGAILTIIISFGGWSIKSIHSNQVAIEKATVQLENIEKNLDKLTENSAESDLIDLEIKALKSELTSSWTVDIKDVENRLDILEMQVSNLNTD